MSQPTSQGHKKRLNIHNLREAREGGRETLGDIGRGRAVVGQWGEGLPGSRFMLTP